MTDPHLEFTPIIIIGAARSGTNALRDALTRLPGFATWPCDEINPIWRHGNLFYPNDELPADRATPKVRAYIRNAFVRLWHQQARPAFVVEKTCANTLRVPFVSAVLPEARYIHIRRNGLDVVASARRRWQGDLEVDRLPYLLAKARYAPLGDLPLYALAYARRKFGLWTGKSKRLSLWGPRFAGLEEMQGASLDLLCASQWAASISLATRAFGAIGPDRVLNVAYEDFARDPVTTLTRIGQFLGTKIDIQAIALAAATVRASSVGKGRLDGSSLDTDVRAALNEPLASAGYDEVK